MLKTSLQEIDASRPHPSLTLDPLIEAVIAGERYGEEVGGDEETI